MKDNNQYSSGTYFYLIKNIKSSKAYVSLKLTMQAKLHVISQAMTLFTYHLY